MMRDGGVGAGTLGAGGSLECAGLPAMLLD